MGNKKKLISYFWILSRLLFIIMSSDALFNVSENASLFFNILNGSSLIYIILMGIIFVSEISKKNRFNYLKLYTGILSIIYGIVMLVFMINLSSDYFSTYESFKIFIWFYALIIAICIWMILFGIHDLRNRKKA